MLIVKQNLANCLNRQIVCLCNHIGRPLTKLVISFSITSVLSKYFTLHCLKHERSLSLNEDYLKSSLHLLIQNSLAKMSACMALLSPSYLTLLSLSASNWGLDAVGKKCLEFILIIN